MDREGFDVYCNCLGIAFENVRINNPLYFCSYSKSICVGAPDYEGNYILDPNSPGELDILAIRKCSIRKEKGLDYKKNIASKVF